jgi:hypothetical protein
MFSTANIQIGHEKLQGTDEDSMKFRLLNALLTHALTAEGVDVIATDIITASSEPDGLKQLAKFYETGLLLPSKPSFSRNIFFIASLINIAF